MSVRSLSPPLRSRRWKCLVTLGACVRVFVSHVRASTPYSHAHTGFACLVMISAHVCCYGLWRYVFVQQYEAYELRGVCCMVLLALWLYGLHERHNTPLFLLSYHLTLIICGPLYFTLMLLMNPHSVIWFGSAICCIQLMCMLVDAVVLLVWTALGGILGTLGWCVIVGHLRVPFIPGDQLAVYAFSLVIALVLDVKSRSVRTSSIRAIRQAMAYVTHQISTPLASVNVTAQWMQGCLERRLSDSGSHVQPASLPHGDGAGLQPLLKGALDELRLAAREIADTLASVSVSGPSAHSGLPCTPLVSCIQPALVLASQRFETRPSMHTDLPGDIHVPLPAPLLTRVLYTLLVNACRSVSAAGSGDITITARASDGQCHLSIRDTGLGIAAPLLGEIFSPFFTFLGAGHSDAGKGMGLYFCRAAIEAWHGQLTVRSTLGVYAEFTLHLPLAAASLSAGAFERRSDR